MGLLDHRRTWRYQVHGLPSQCLDGFVAAFDGSGGLLMKAKWSIDRSADRAVAVYEGRKGVVAVATMMMQTAQAEQDGALGSQVTFEVETSAEGTTTCAMWLSSSATRLGFTNDGRFMRPYMRAVESQLRQIDPAVAVMKG